MNATVVDPEKLPALAVGKVSMDAQQSIALHERGTFGREEWERGSWDKITFADVNITKNMQQEHTAHMYIVGPRYVLLNTGTVLHRPVKFLKAAYVFRK